MSKQKEYAKQYYLKNKIKINKWRKGWRADNRKGNKEKVSEQIRRYNLKRVHGITLEEYNELFIKQEGRCAICGKHQSELKTSLHVDHNHETDEIRGLLCMQCNIILGWYEILENDLELVEKVLKYIKTKKQC